MVLTILFICKSRRPNLGQLYEKNVDHIWQVSDNSRQFGREIERDSLID